MATAIQLLREARLAPELGVQPSVILAAVGCDEDEPEMLRARSQLAFDVVRMGCIGKVERTQ